jgi:hypothetical protein
MQRAELVLLEKGVDDLGADIVAVVAENGAVFELLRAACNVVLGVEVVIAALGDEVEPGAEGIVEGFVAGTRSGDDGGQDWP